MRNKLDRSKLQLIIVEASCLLLVQGNTKCTNKTVTEILDGLLTKENYDSRLRPNYDGEPVQVEVGFWVLSIDAINVVDMDFSLDIFFRQTWRDQRLDHGLNSTMFLSNTVMDRIWMPDSYFVNAKQGNFHKVTTDNIMIMIMPGGVVKYNARITIKAACPMDLRKFPMDTQFCPLTIESYGYSQDHIKFKWEKDLTDGMSFVPNNLEMLPQYTLTNLSLKQTQNAYVVGNWSGIEAKFTFERMSSYFLIHVYGPCALIVIISWMSFLLPRSSPPARVKLGVTSVLTVVTILNMLNNSMPKVNYVKTIDSYLIGCFLFVFATLAEYSIVLFLAARMKRYQQTKDYKNGNRRHEIETDPSKSSLLSNAEELANGMQKEKPNKICSNHLEMMEFSKMDEEFQDFRSAKRKGSMWPNTGEWKKRFYNERAILAVDEYSLALFPVSFAMFNLAYWLYFINTGSEPVSAH
ncbi:Gamma-aminobutyric acid receptor subunit beta-4 [Acropora cervicornis]|uniref:Gamma-aminobutyric acid receptor subunit beta n=1 Tax=Acropora cervicornis TaxID=6130 RepID=A0AAD9QYY4_ACRCE|nr:Gamma-aminobutyric acid receptor subunit beta-4 [Acropora cervicornis]